MRQISVPRFDIDIVSHVGKKIGPGAAMSDKDSDVASGETNQGFPDFRATSRVEDAVVYFGDDR